MSFPPRLTPPCSCGDNTLLPAPLPGAPHRCATDLQVTGCLLDARVVRVVRVALSSLPGVLQEVIRQQELTGTGGRSENQQPIRKEQWGLGLHRASCWGTLGQGPGSGIKSHGLSEEGRAYGGNRVCKDPAAWNSVGTARKSSAVPSVWSIGEGRAWERQRERWSGP